MGQIPSVLCQWSYVFVSLCLVSSQRAEATPAYALSSEERLPLRVTRYESTQSITSIWSENFTSPVTLTSGDATKTNVQSGKLVSSNDEAVWTSQSIDISSYTDVKIAVDLSSVGTLEGDDYLQVYYKLDGGPETPLLNGRWFGDVGPTTAMIGDLNGNSVQVIVKFRTDDAAEEYAIDNARVYTEPSERHAIQNGNWNTGSTWSYTSGGGACSCVPDLWSDTYIDSRTVSILNHSNTHNLTVNGGGKVIWTAVKNLRLWGDALLNTELGSEISEGAGGEAYISFNQWNSRETHATDQTPTALGYPGVSVSIVLDQPSSFLISGLQINAAGNFIIQGTGNLETSLDLKVAHEANITNDLVGNLVIGDDFSMDFPGSTFVNNQEIVIGDELRLNRDNSIFTNNKAVEVGTKLALSGSSSSFANRTGAYLTVGTILQINENNTFTNEGVTETYDLAISAISAGGGELINRGDFYVYNRFNTYNKPFTVHNHNSFEAKGDITFADQLKLYNHEQTNWYFGGQVLDADLQLFAEYQNNTVVYNGNTNQPVLIPRDVNNPTQPGTYWHLMLGTTISGPGNSVKTPTGDALDINGNLEIGGVLLNEVTLDVSANNTNVNLAGDWWRYDKNATSFVAGSTTNNETVTFDGDSDQRLRTYEQFISVVIDKTEDLLLEEGSSVAGTATFTQGIIVAQNDQPLVFRPDALAANASDASHVTGPVTKQGNADFTFPVGDGTDYRPLSLSGLSIASDFTVEYHNTNPTNDGYALTSVSSPLLNVSGCAYWESERTGAAEAFVTLTWDENSCPVDINDLTIVRWDDTQWVTVPSTATGTASSGSITSDARLSTFGIFTLTERNDVPQATKDNAITQEGTSVAINVPQNDTDRNGIDPTTVTVTAPIQHGTTTVDATTGTITYVPNADFAGKDSLRYTIKDIKGLMSNEATVVIVVGANEPEPTGVVNTAPLAHPDAFVTNEDQALSGDLSINDTDPELDILTFTLDPTNQPVHGTLLINLNGAFTYVPDTDSFGSDQFAYQLCDGGNPSLCDTALVTITVLPINDVPVAVDDAFTVVEGDTIIANVAANDTDPEGDPLGNVSLLTAPANGSVTLEPSGRFTYGPDRYYVGTDQFTYRICDDQNPPLCDEALVVIQIQAGLLDVPKAFSPNQDQINDAWIIPGIRAYPNNTVTIFNRWGNAVYRERSYDNQMTFWQGKASRGMITGSQPLPEGTYFYVIDLGEGQKPMSGYVLLKR